MNPQEQFEHIVTLIADREQRGYPTFYTIKIEKFGKLSPIVEREAGEKNFSNILFKCLSTYQPNTIQVELFTGKSRKVHEPFQSFKIPIKKANTEITLSGTEEKPEFMPSENVISVERFYDAKFEMQSRLMRMEFDNQRLIDVIEKLNGIIEGQKETIDELEKEVEETLRKQKDNIANISLGHIGSIALEKFAKSDTGIGLLKGILGATDDQLKGLTGKEISEEKQEPKSTATIVSKPQEQQPLTEEQKIRKQITDTINEHFGKVDNFTLRLYYEIISKIAGQKEKLEKVKQLLQVMQQQKENRSKPTPLTNTINLNTTTNNKTSEQGEETGEEEAEPYDST